MAWLGDDEGRGGQAAGEPLDPAGHARTVPRLWDDRDYRLGGGERDGDRTTPVRPRRGGAGAGDASTSEARAPSTPAWVGEATMAAWQ
jgi:hypothetical protein